MNYCYISYCSREQKKKKIYVTRTLVESEFSCSAPPPSFYFIPGHPDNNVLIRSEKRTYDIFRVLLKRVIISFGI